MSAKHETVPNLLAVISVGKLKSCQVDLYSYSFLKIYINLTVYINFVQYWKVIKWQNYSYISLCNKEYVYCPVNIVFKQ